MALHHLEAWSQVEGAEVVAITNRTQQKAVCLAQRFGIDQVCSSTEELLRGDAVNVVSIAMPHSLHHPLAMAAVDAGKHVFCEKPLATSLADALEMRDRARAAGVKTGVQLGHRVLPGLNKLRSLLADGEIGHVEHIACSWCFNWARDPRLPLIWRFRREMAGAGALADLGVYAIDVARWLLGELESVVGHTQTVVKRRPLPIERYDFDRTVRLAREGALDVSDEMRTVENEDECTYLARFENGAHGVFRASRVQHQQRLEIFGTRGALRWHLQGDRLWSKLEGQPDYIEIRVLRPARQLTFVHPFAQDIREDTSCGPTFDDGVKAQAVIEAVLRSASEGRWVPVPELGWPSRQETNRGRPAKDCSPTRIQPSPKVAPTGSGNCRMSP
jgi:predicted dehydrogenase